jgi:hypothetical protein
VGEWSNEHKLADGRETPEAVMGAAEEQFVTAQAKA